MAENYIRIESRSPFTQEFMYFDVEPYKADDIFIEYGIRPKFYEHITFEGSPYLLIRCKVSRRDVHLFEQAMAKLKQKMLLTGNEDYGEWCEHIWDMLDEAIDGNPPPFEEYEHLKAQVENLTLYLEDVAQNHPDIMAELDDKFDGMPGLQNVQDGCNAGTDDKDK